MNVSCPICNNASCKKEAQYGTSEQFYKCPRCGSFVPEGIALDFLIKGIENGSIDRSVLSYHLRKRQRPDGQVAKLSSNDLKEFIDDHQLPNPQEQLNNFILLVGNEQANPASYASFTNPDALAALIGCAVDTNPSGTRNFDWLWSQIKTKDFFQIAPERGVLSFRLTMSGWELFEKLKHQSKDSYRAFMAMAFNQPDIHRMMKEYFKPASTLAGFDLKPLNEGQPAGLIDNQIRAAIRTAAFVVADLTHENNGAYFEAGFAEGLGVPVIYTCQDEVFDKKKTHFDTSHMVTIPWNLAHPEDAANKLTATIRATLPAKAKLND